MNEILAQRLALDAAQLDWIDRSRVADPHFGAALERHIVSAHLSELEMQAEADMLAGEIVEAAVDLRQFDAAWKALMGPFGEM